MTIGIETRCSGRSAGRHVVLIAAHNQEANIGAALRWLAAQPQPPDEVIVLADRCTDRTAEIAASHGASVFHTVGEESSTPTYTLNARLQVAQINVQPSDCALAIDAYGD